MARIPFLVDENVPQEVTDFLRARGHTVFTVGEHLAKSSPDPLLTTIAEELGLVVVTFDRDFRRLIRRLPRGSGRAVPRRAGRISLTCDETEARARIEA